MRDHITRAPQSCYSLDGRPATRNKRSRQGGIVEAEIWRETLASELSTSPGPDDRRRADRHTYSVRSAFHQAACRRPDARATKIGEVLASRPGTRLEFLRVIDVHHNAVPFLWRLERADGTWGDISIDFGEVGPDGRLVEIVGFFGPAPALP